MGILLRRLANLIGNAAQVEHQFVEDLGHARQLRHDVAGSEGVIADAPLADLVSDISEAPQAEADAEGDQEDENRKHEVDSRSKPDFSRFPVWPADRGVEKFRRGMG